jgi:hypothetical protein
MRRRGIEGPIVLTADGFPGHLSLDIQKFCNANNIILIILLANATSFIQPLDVGVFKSLKAEVKKQTRQYKRVENVVELDEVDFIKILSRALKIAVTPELIKKSFETTGIYPPQLEYPHPERLLTSNLPTTNVATPQPCASQSPVISESQIASQTQSSVPEIPTGDSQTQNMVSTSTLSSTQSQSDELIQNFQKFNESFINSIREGNLATEQSQKAIQLQMKFLQSITSQKSSSSIDDIFTIPTVPPIKRKKTFKLKKQGVVSDRETITASEEEKEVKEAAAKEIFERKRARIEKREENLRIKRQKVEENKKKKALKKHRAVQKHPSEPTRRRRATRCDI